MKIVFCCDPLNNESPDSMYIDEVAAATHAGLPYVLIDFKALHDQKNAARAVRDVPVQHQQETAIYRGWRMTLSDYTALYDALYSRGLRLINSPHQYEFTQYLPRNYHLIEDHTPATLWMQTHQQPNMQEVLTLTRQFGDRPLILKDYVKSAKHYWLQACFIPTASDDEAVQRVVRQFMKLQGNDLEGGLVFREYLELQSIGKHPRSGMPLSREYRTFYLNGQPILTLRYWDVDDVEDVLPDMQPYNQIAKQVRSQFFTLDTAQLATGEWIIVELGDAQTAQIPRDSGLDAFYQHLATSAR